MPRTVTLSKPLKTHKGEVTELVLRDLTAADMVEMRESPTKVSFVRQGRGENQVVEQKIDIRYDLMLALAGRICEGADVLILKNLSAGDFNKLVTACSELWNDAEGESSAE